MNQNKFQFGGKLRAILMLLAFVIVGVGFTTMLSKEVTLVHDGNSAVYNTTSSTVKDFLVEKKIDIVDHLYVSPATNTQIENGMKITVRTPQEVIILDNGVEKKVKTGNLLVADILKEYGYKLQEQDYAVPDLDESIAYKGKNEPVIIINRVYHKTITEVATIPFDIETKENAKMPKGTAKVLQEGQDGSKTVVTGITVMNDVEVESHIISEEIVKKPVNRVLEVGTKIEDKAASVVASLNEVSKTGSSSSNSNGAINGRRIKRVITMNATAYDASFESNGSWGPVTALGTSLRPGVVAVDKNVIPLGTRLYIESTDGWPSYGMAVAEDTGGAIKGNRIDLFFSSPSTVSDFGRRVVKVYVLE